MQAVFSPATLRLLEEELSWCNRRCRLSTCTPEEGIILSFASKSDDANGTYKPALQALGAANLQN